MNAENFNEEYLKDPLSMPDSMLDAMNAMEQPASEPSVDEPVIEKSGDIEGAAPSTDDPKATKEGSLHPEAPQGDAAPGSDTDPKNSVVKSKDGKHEIPYEVLRQEREGRIRAESATQELVEKIALLTNAKETGASIKSRSVTDIVDEDMLAQLDEESPLVAETIRSLIGSVNELEGELSKAQPLVEQNQRESQIQHQLSVEDAIAAVPKLAHLRIEDPATFNDIADIDSMLRAQPKWKGAPIQDRFEAALRMHEAANGAVELPGAIAPVTTPDDAAKRVEAAVNKAEASARGPNTLSDIPGGGLPATDELASIESMSASSLTEKMLSMTDDQRDAFLARLT